MPCWFRPALYFDSGSGTCWKEAFENQPPLSWFFFLAFSPYILWIQHGRVHLHLPRESQGCQEGVSSLWRPKLCSSSFPSNAAISHLLLFVFYCLLPCLVHFVTRKWGVPRCNTWKHVSARGELQQLWQWVGTNWVVLMKTFSSYLWTHPQALKQPCFCSWCKPHVVVGQTRSLSRRVPDVPESDRHF